MAKEDKKKSSRSKAMRNIAKSGMMGPASKHLKYGDFMEKDIHTGPISYRGQTFNDEIVDGDFSTSIDNYSRNVASKGGKKGFVFQNRLYAFNMDHTFPAYTAVASR
jgi:hypothetical protein